MNNAALGAMQRRTTSSICRLLDEMRGHFSAMSRDPACETYLQIWHAHGAFLHFDSGHFGPFTSSTHPSSPMLSGAATPRWVALNPQIGHNIGFQAPISNPISIGTQ